MMQMHLSTKQKQTPRQRTDCRRQEAGCGKGWSGSLGLVGANCHFIYIYIMSICIAQAAVFNIL